MKTNGGFLVSKIKQLGDRIFEKILSTKNVDAFNGAQGRILYVLWQEDGIPIKAISERCGLAITSLTTMLERMENQELILRVPSESDRRKTLLYLTEKAHALKDEYDTVSDQMSKIYYKGFVEEEVQHVRHARDRCNLRIIAKDIGRRAVQYLRQIIDHPDRNLNLARFIFLNSAKRFPDQVRQLDLVQMLFLTERLDSCPDSGIVESLHKVSPRT